MKHESTHTRISLKDSDNLAIIKDYMSELTGATLSKVQVLSILINRKIDSINEEKTKNNNTQ